MTNENDADLESKTLEELEEEYKDNLIGTIKKQREHANADTPLDVDAGLSSKDKVPSGDKQRFYDGFRKKYSMLEHVEYSEQGLTGFAMVNDDASCDDDVSDWEPADIYCDLIFQYAYCFADLRQVCIQACDIGMGKGNKMQYKLMGQRTTQTGLAACECMSCGSNTWTTYTITLDRYGDYNILCGLDIWSVGDNLREQTIKGMGLAFKQALDAEIYSQLVGATAGFDNDSAASATCDATISGSCCSYTAQYYKAIVDLEAEMRDANYHPDYLIINPRIAAFLKYKEGIDVPDYVVGDIQVTGGKLTRIGNLKVIEFCGANGCTNAGDAITAVMVDSSRAIGLGWGHAPIFEQRRVGECDSLRVTFNAYVGVDEFDLNGIGFIRNP